MLNKDYRNDFPIFSQKTRGKPLVYLDSSATSQKPHCVIQAMQHFYQTTNANIHRGVYELSERATALYENTRKKVKKFINAEQAHEIIFVRGATEGINLVAHSYGQQFCKEGDEIIISTMEHHSNIVPWQLLCERIGATLKIIPIHDNGELDLETYQTLFSSRTKLVAVSHASNVLGTINPIKKITRIAHEHQVPVLVDGAQAFPHLPVDVIDLDCDFYVFSSHKAYGPTGVGVLYGKSKWLEIMSPYQGGGDMIESVTFEKSTYKPIPFKFEAGTPNIANVIGFAAALDYLNEIGMTTIQAHEKELTMHALQNLSNHHNVKVFGQAKERLGVISFTLTNAHAHDIGTILDYEGVAIRVGHHCAMPLMNRFNVAAMARISFGIYNTMDDINVFLRGLAQVNEVFAHV